jgi:hypothetical protein
MAIFGLVLDGRNNNSHVGECPEGHADISKK